MSSLDAALVRVRNTLDAMDRRFAVVGGIAVSALVDPRTTGDIDIAVAVDGDDDAETVVRALIEAGFEMSSALEQAVTGRLAGIRALDAQAGVHVDVLFAMSGVEPEIVASARPLELLPGTVVPVATIGSLIVMKLLARDDRRRPADADDLRALRASASARDWDQARELVQLVTERGAHRGRDLSAALAQLRSHGAY